MYNDAELDEEPCSDASDSLSHSSISQSDDSSSDLESENEGIDTHGPASRSKSSTILNSKRVVYYHTSYSEPVEFHTEIKQKLQTYLPNTVVLLEPMTGAKTPYSDRKVLNSLLTQVVEGKVDEILVAESNHLCLTKDGFNVLDWMCKKLGAKVFILPALHSIAKQQ